jgi:hypothetical protein
VGVSRRAERSGMSAFNKLGIAFVASALLFTLVISLL